MTAVQFNMMKRLRALGSAIGARAPAIKRVLKWVLKGGAVLVGLPALVWIVTLLIASCRLESKLREIAQDPALTAPTLASLDNLAPEQNGAPDFSAALALIMEYDNDDFDLLFSFISHSEDDRVLTQEESGRLRAWIASKEPAFQRAARGAEKPSCRFDRSWADRNPWRPWIPEVSGVRVLVWALIARARFQALDNLPADARHSMRLAFAVADSLRDDPFLWSQQFRNWGHHVIYGNLALIVPTQASKEELAQWLKIVPMPNAYDGWLDRSIRWELHRLARMLGQPIEKFWSEFDARREGERAGFWKILQRRLADPLVMLDGVRALDDLSFLAGNARLPYPQGRENQDRVDTERAGRWTSWAAWNPVRARFMEPAAGRLGEFEQTRAMCIVVRTGLEWEMTRLETGEYPKEVTAVDPLTGKPLLLESSPLRLTSDLPKQPYIVDPPERFSWTLWRP